MKIFDRDQWNEKIALAGDWPDWFCSECMKGSLYPVLKTNKEEKELIAESAGIKYLRHNPPWLDSDNYYAHMVIKLECSNPKCSSESLLSGIKTNKEHRYEEQGIPRESYIDYFEPMFFTIPPQVIYMPKNDLDESVKFLYQSFKIFFEDPSSAANKIRIFLDQLFPKTTNNSGPLHARLENELKQPHPDIFELFMACKWIGNDASHEGDIVHEDILDAYEFIEAALDLMYPRGENTSSLLHKAGNINTNKQSVSKINQQT